MTIRTTTIGPGDTRPSHSRRFRQWSDRRAGGGDVLRSPVRDRTRGEAAVPRRHGGAAPQAGGDARRGHRLGTPAMLSCRRSAPSRNATSATASSRATSARSARRCCGRSRAASARMERQSRHRLDRGLHHSFRVHDRRSLRPVGCGIEHHVGRLFTRAEALPRRLHLRTADRARRPRARRRRTAPRQSDPGPTPSISRRRIARSRPAASSTTRRSSSASSIRSTPTAA